MVDILDIYKANLGHPNAVSLRETVQWDSWRLDTQPLIVQPASGDLIYIKQLQVLFDRSANIHSRRQVRIRATQASAPSSGGVDLVLDNENDVLAAMDMPSYHRTWTAPHTVGVITFEPPIKLVGPNDKFEVRYENESDNTLRTSGLKDGYIHWTVTGWVLLVADID